jgi:hypothetical protein
LSNFLNLSFGRFYVLARYTIALVNTILFKNS